MHFSTRAIHAGQEPDPTTGSTVPPVHLTSVYTYDTLEGYRNKTTGYDYSRYGNPTRTALEICLASLEGAKHALAFSSGMAAIDAALRLLKLGDHAVVSEDVYGGAWGGVEGFFRAAGAGGGGFRPP